MLREDTTISFGVASMHPLSYANVFTGDVPANPALLVVGIAVTVGLACTLVAIILSGFCAGTGNRWVSLAAGVLGSMALLSIITATVSLITYYIINDSYMKPYQVQVENMNANLTQKYHATLIDPKPGASYYSADALASGDNQYMLALPNGKTGLYYIKWDKATSDPTIMDEPPRDPSPTPEQLNQTANKG